MAEADDRRQVGDTEISAAYKALAAERSPQELDRRILRLAIQDVRADAPRNWLASRIRPLAFFVTAGLTLALILQLSNTPYFDVPITTAPTNDEPASEPLDTFRDAARDTAEQVRRLDADASTSTNDPDRESAVSAPVPETRLQKDDRCPDSVRTDSAAWWECVQDLEKQGLSQAAEAELRLLLEKFPQFAAPQR